MGRAKIAISLDEQTVNRIDRLVGEKVYLNRSRAIEAAIEETLNRMDRTRLARECAKLDPSFERALAEEGMTRELRDWPAY